MNPMTSSVLDNPLPSDIGKATKVKLEITVHCVDPIHLDHFSPNGDWECLVVDAFNNSNDYCIDATIVVHL